ncbi:hypothetical protein EDD17DRAFT_1540243 [Pisolithus thermaeus]|nr:hypothetical protein EDD17DRAFT_1540243 [Pisolithus thermaeus]
MLAALPIIYLTELASRAHAALLRLHGKPPPTKYPLPNLPDDACIAHKTIVKQWCDGHTETTEAKRSFAQARINCYE